MPLAWALIFLLQAPVPIQAAAANDVPLREYIERVVDARFAAIEQRFTWLEQGTKLAREELRERLAGMNEFRDQLKDQASRFVTRKELDDIVAFNAVRVAALEKANANYEGRLWMLGAGVVAINLAIHFWHRKGTPKVEAQVNVAQDKLKRT